MADIHVGTSGWSYPTGKGTWNGVFYPARRRRGFDELAYYAEHFDTVEINSTFYRMPEAPVSQSWVRRSPPGFLFSVKLFQKFTHPDLYLKKTGASEWDLSRDDLDRFRLGIEPLAAAGRLVALLIQFPASFHAGPETRDFLDWLLGGLESYPLIVELRHRSWSDTQGETDHLLDTHHADWAHIDEPKFASSIRQEEMTSGVRGRFVPPSSAKRRAPLYVRLHGRNAANWWKHAEMEDRYDYLYSPAELQPFARVAKTTASSGRRVLMYLNNHFSAKAVANAALLKHELGQPVPGEYPTEMIERYPDLAGVVTTSGLPL